MSGAGGEAVGGWEIDAAFVAAGDKLTADGGRRATRGHTRR